MTTNVSQASTSSAGLAYLEESTFGTVEAGTPKYLRMTKPDLNFGFTMSTSSEINNTGQVTDAIITDASASGGIDFEMQYHEYDPFIEALLRDEFNTYGTGGVKSLSLTFALGAGTITGAGGSFTGLVVGQYFSIKDSTLNDGVYRIGTVSDTVITVDAGTPLVSNEGPTASVKISSTRVSCGTDDLRTFSMETSLSDVDQFFMHRGRAISGMDLNFATGQILTGTFATVGKDMVRGDVTQFPGGAADPAESFGIMNAVTGLGSILVRDGVAADILEGAYITSMKVSVSGNLREQKAIGSLGAIGIGRSRFAISGTLEVYLVTGSIYDEALAQNLISIAFPVVDAENNGYAFIFDNVKLKPPTISIGGIDQDVIMSVEFTAVAPDTSTDKMIIIDRFGDSVVAAT